MRTKQHKTEAQALAGVNARDVPFAVPIGAEFQRRYGPSRSVQYQLVESGAIQSVLIGDRRGRRYIIVDSYLDYVRQQQEREAVYRAANGGNLRHGWLERDARSHEPADDR
jgi:hypothetical protein